MESTTSNLNGSHTSHSHGEDGESAAWVRNVLALRERLTHTIPHGAAFLLVDDDQLRSDLTGLEAIPFPECEWQYGGAPAGDAVAIEELERQRQAGITFIVMAWPSFWWRDYYPKFFTLLQRSFPCIHQDELAIIFDLRDSHYGLMWEISHRLAWKFRLESLSRYLSSAGERFVWWLRMARLAHSVDDRHARHLCELICSTRFSQLPRVTLTACLARLAESAATPLGRVIVHPRLRGEGSGSASEMAALAAITAAHQPKQILEFGTYDGCSTWHLWANSPDEARIVTIDLPPNMKVQGSTDVGFQGVTRRQFLPRDARVELILTDSRTWDPDLRNVDLCFIDAGHSYECVRNDTEKALSLMKKGGIILWHDATWRRNRYGVNQYLRELRQQGHDVRQLVVSAFDYCSLAILVI